MPWTQSIALEPETECSVLLWGDGEWDVIEGDEARRWVFQPTGMASPAASPACSSGRPSWRPASTR